MVVFTGPHEHVIGMKARVQNTSEAICMRLDNLSFSMEKDTKPHKACYLNLCLKGHGTHASGQGTVFQNSAVSPRKGNSSTDLSVC